MLVCDKAGLGCAVNGRGLGVLLMGVRRAVHRKGAGSCCRWEGVMLLMVISP